MGFHLNYLADRGIGFEQFIQLLIKDKSLFSKKRLKTEVINANNGEVLTDFNSHGRNFPNLKPRRSIGRHMSEVSICTLPGVCSPGYEGDGFTCTMCEIGTYKPEANNTVCTSCPEELSTNQTGSVPEQQCSKYTSQKCERPPIIDDFVC